MRSKRLNLLSTLSFLSLSIMAMPKLEAIISIANGVTVNSTGQASDNVNFTGGPPGGTFVMDPNNSYTANLQGVTNTNSGVGQLVMNTNSHLTGAVGQAMGALFSITVNGQGSTITGATSAFTFNLGQNALGITGALNNPSGTIINTRVVSNALFGNIAIGALADSIAGPSITVNVDASGVTALTPGAPLFIISAGSGTNGSTVIVTSNNVLYSFIGQNLQGNVTITPTLSPSVASSLPAGVGSVFTALLTVAANNPGSDIATVVNAIGALPNAAAIASALAQLNPNAEGAIPQVSFQAAKEFTNIFAEHMGYGRCVYAAECDEDCSKNDQLTEEQRRDCALKKKEGCFSEMNCDNVENRYELWADAFGYAGHQNTRETFPNYKSRIFGGMLGFQAPLSRDTSIGLGAGYAQSWIDRGNHNDTDIQTYDGTLYFSYDPTHWYIDTALSFDWQQYHDKRRIDFPGINRTARANYGGQEYSALLATGYRFYTSICAIFTPLASIEYSYLHVNKYHEHGAGDIDLHVKSQNYNFLESTLGLKVSGIVQTRKFAVVPEVHAFWLYNFFADRQNLTSTFSGVAEEAGSFKLKGPGFDRNLGDVGGGISFITCRKLAVELVYNYQFSEHFHANEGLVRITKRF